MDFVIWSLKLKQNVTNTLKYAKMWVILLSIRYCHSCDKHIDTDTNAEHFDTKKEYEIILTRVLRVVDDFELAKALLTRVRKANMGNDDDYHINTRERLRCIEEEK